MAKAIILLSGGLDSATTLYLAKKQGYQCYCLICDYGQRHRREIKSAKAIAHYAKCKAKVIKISLPWKGSSLLDKKITIPETIKLSKYQVNGKIPNTYVPARNIIFLSFALSYAETIGANTIFIGANAIDFSVAAHSRVIKKNLGAVSIQSIKPGDNVLTMDKKNLTIEWSKVKNLVEHSYLGQLMYRIVTEHGRNIDVCGGHSLFSLNENGEIGPARIEKLKKGDYILAPSKLKIFGNLRKINLLDLLKDEQFIFITHPKIGSLIRRCKNEKERWWKRKNIMPISIYNQSYRKISNINDRSLFIKSGKGKKRAISAILRLDAELCFFLGLWLADGCFGSRNVICVSCDDSEAMKNLKTICKLFRTRIYVDKNKIDRQISSALLIKIMKKLGFNGTAKTKIIPPIIYNLPLTLQSAFLRGYIIGDGCVEENGPITIASVNESLINGLQDLLLNFGIIAYKKKQTYAKTNFIDKSFSLYRLSIENSVDKKLFLKYIGNIKNKVSVLPAYRSKIRGIPSYKMLNHDLKTFSTIPKLTEVKNMIRNNAIYTENRFNRQLLAKLMDYTSSKVIKGKWSRLINNELIFTKIRQKKKIAYDCKYIYDISIDKNENFICEGLVAHNSGYPDCRPEFYRAFETVISTGTKSGAKKKKIRIETPLVYMTKAQIIRLGIQLGVPFKLTWSCYKGGKFPCGRCDSCQFRISAFRDLGLQDPLLTKRA